MKNTRFISILLITALIVSVFGFTNFARAATGSCNVSVNVTGPHNAFAYVTNCFGDYDFQYWTGSTFRNIHYGSASGTSSIGLINLLEGTTYSYRIGSGSTGSFTTTLDGSSSFGSTNNTNNTNTSNNSGNSNGGQVLGSTSGSGTGSGTGGYGTGGTGSSNIGSGNGSGTGTSNSGSSGSGSSATSNQTGSSTSRTPVSASDPYKDRPSYVSLEYSLGNDGALVLVSDNLKPKPGEEFSYTIVYKNETDVTFNEANLKVILPTQVDYVGSDNEPNNISANIIEFKLGNIKPRAQGIVVVVVKVKETVEPGTNMIFTSVLGYKDSKGVQLAETSYMTVKVSESGSPLSASIGSFVGTSAILWLIAIVLMIMMGLLVFRLVKMRRNLKKDEENDIFSSGKIPATFEPVGQVNSFFK